MSSNDTAVDLFAFRLVVIRHYLIDACTLLSVLGAELIECCGAGMSSLRDPVVGCRQSRSGIVSLTERTAAPSGALCLPPCDDMIESGTRPPSDGLSVSVSLCFIGPHLSAAYFL